MAAIDLSSIHSLATYGSEVFAMNGGSDDGTYMFGFSTSNYWFFRWLMGSPYTATAASTADTNDVIGISAPSGSYIYVAEKDYSSPNHGIQLNQYSKSTLTRTGTGTFYTFSQPINYTYWGGAISDGGGYTAVAFAAPADGVGRLEVYQESTLSRVYTLSLSGASGNVNQAMPMCIAADTSYVYSVALDASFNVWLTKRAWSDLGTVADYVSLGAGTSYLGTSIVMHPPESGTEVYIGTPYSAGTSRIERRSTTDLSLQDTSVDIAGSTVTNSAFFGPMAISGNSLLIVAMNATSSASELFELPGGPVPKYLYGSKPGQHVTTDIDVYDENLSFINTITNPYAVSQIQTSFTSSTDGWFLTARNVGGYYPASIMRIPNSAPISTGTEIWRRDTEGWMPWPAYDDTYIFGASNTSGGYPYTGELARFDKSDGTKNSVLTEGTGKFRCICVDNDYVYLTCKGGGNREVTKYTKSLSLVLWDTWPSSPTEEVAADGSYLYMSKGNVPGLIFLVDKNTMQQYEYNPSDAWGGGVTIANLPILTTDWYYGYFQNFLQNNGYIYTYWVAWDNSAQEHWYYVRIPTIDIINNLGGTANADIISASEIGTWMVNLSINQQETYPIEKLFAHVLT